MKFFLTLNTKWGCQQPKTEYSPTLVQNQILARGGVSRVTPGEHLLPLPRCSPGCPGRQSKVAHCSPDNYHDGDRDHQKCKTDQFYIIVYHTECLPLAFPINRGPLWATICGIVDYKFWRYLVEILGARIFCKLYFMHQLHHQYLFCFKSLHISDWKTLAKTTYWRVAAGDHPVVKQTLLFLSRPLPTACS